MNDTSIQQLIKQAREGDESRRLQAASDLGRLGIRTRGGPAVRGTLEAAATPRMDRDSLAAATAALADEAPGVRCEVAFALGEWADAAAVDALVTRARHDVDWNVRVAAVDALAKIGGREAVLGLQAVARDDTHEDVRAGAISGLTTLALAAQEAAKPAGAVRTRGGITRTRGGASDTPNLQGVLTLLDEIRASDSSDYCRSLASHLGVSRAD